MKKAIVLVLCLLGCLAASGSLANAANQPAQAAIPRFARLGSSDGYLAPPTASLEQTSTILLDVDKDGITDVAIGSRRSPGPSMSWYRRSGKAWTRYLIEPDVLSIEPGGVAGDVDGDGDLDIINGGDYQSNKVWWWENP